MPALSVARAARPPSTRQGNNDHLEWTAWEGSKACGWSGQGEHREILHVGIVRLSRDLSEEGYLCLLVRLRANPVLSDYVQALTGLRQDDIDAHGIEAPDALARLAAFLGPRLMLCMGSDSLAIADTRRIHGIAAPLPRTLVALAPWLRRLGIDTARTTSGMLNLLTPTPRGTDARRPP